MEKLATKLLWGLFVFNMIVALIANFSDAPYFEYPLLPVLTAIVSQSVTLLWLALYTISLLEYKEN